MKKTERFKRWLIRKLGGFVIYPDDAHVVIEHIAVRPDKIIAHCIFTQQQLYEVNGNILEIEAQKKLKEKIAQMLTASTDHIDLNKTQDAYGNIEYTATLYVINPKYMPHKRKDG